MSFKFCYFLKFTDAFDPKGSPDNPGENQEKPNASSPNEGGDNCGKLPKVNETVSNLGVSDFKKSKKPGEVAPGLSGAAGVRFSVDVLSNIR